MSARFDPGVNFGSGGLQINFFTEIRQKFQRVTDLFRRNFQRFFRQPDFAELPFSEKFDKIVVADLIACFEHLMLFEKVA